MPYVIAVAGSVAVGKSTTSRLLQTLLTAGPGSPRVDLVTTDGFLLPNGELEARGLLGRKGFPESYDRRALLRFLADVKSGRGETSSTSPSTSTPPSPTCSAGTSSASSPCAGRRSPTPAPTSTASPT